MLNLHVWLNLMNFLNHWQRWAVLVVLIIGAGLVIPFTRKLPVPFVGVAAAPKITLDSSPLPRADHPIVSYAAVVKKVSPSVVNIYTSKTLHIDPAIREYLQELYGFDQVPKDRREQSLGSGVIVSQDGYILTNNHVVQGADEIKVALGEETTIYDAKVVGTDPLTDIAVIKVQADNLPSVVFGDSSKIEVGDVTIAIGDPFGVGQTVTQGIVSAKDRGGIGIANYEDFIQTDASINPGNSGGALVDAEGRLVGLNTAILSRTGGNQGIGFAVPVNLARYVMERIVVDGKVTRGYLGVKIQPLTQDLAKQSNLTERKGALIAEVTPGSPGDHAVLTAGDIVEEFDGKPVTNSLRLQLMVAEKAPGSEVALKVIRQGKEQTLTVKLGELPSELSSEAIQRKEGNG
jgi:serine protease Do